MHHCNKPVANHFNQTSHSLDKFKVAILIRIQSACRQIREIKELQLIAKFDSFEWYFIKIVLLWLVIADVL